MKKFLISVILILIIFLSLTIKTNAQISTGLVGYWSFDEGSGNTASDSSGNNNSGTLTNSSWITPGKIGSSAISFNGASAEMVKTSFSGDTNSGGSFAGWIKVNSYANDFAGVISTNNVGILIVLRNSQAIQIMVRDNAGNTVANMYESGASAIPAQGSWAHITVTWNANSISYYLNGVFVDLKPGVSSYQNIRGDTIYLGSDREISGRFLNGQLDDVRLYSRALSSAEVSQLYALDTGSNPITPNPVTPPASTTPVTPTVPTTPTIPATTTTPTPTQTNHFFTICSSGCDSTTIQGFFNSHTPVADDVIEIRADVPGGSKTYIEASRVVVSGNGSSGHPITLRARAGDYITIDSQGSGGNTLLIDASYYIVDGIKVQGSQGAQIYVGQVGSTCRAQRDTDIIIRNSSTYAAGTQSGPNHEGIMVNCANNVTLKNNNISTSNIDMGLEDSDGVYAAQFSNLTIDGNYIVISNNAVSINPHNDGVQISGGNGTSFPLGGTSNLTIKNNYIVHNSNKQGYKQCIFVEYEVRGYVDIYNNTCIDTTNANTHILSVMNNGFGSEGIVRIFNNTIFINGAIASAIRFDGVGNQFVNNPFIKNNAVYWSGTNDYQSCISIEPAQTIPSQIDNNICQKVGGTVLINRSSTFYTWPNWVASGFDVHGYNADPGFVNISNYPYNLHLSTNSIGRGSGANLYSFFTTDEEGNSRLSSGPWDVGAYQSSGGTTVTPPTPIIGDFNNDRLVNSLDFSLLVSAWNQNNATYDINHDGIVNSLDYVVMVQNWTQ